VIKSIKNFDDYVRSYEIVEDCKNIQLHYVKEEDKKFNVYLSDPIDGYFEIGTTVRVGDPVMIDNDTFEVDVKITKPLEKVASEQKIMCRIQK